VASSDYELEYGHPRLSEVKGAPDMVRAGDIDF